MLPPNIETFIGCDSSYRASSIVLYGAPYDSTTSYRPGARFGPAAIRHESYGLETFSPYQNADLTDYDIFDSGDLELCFGSSESALADIQQRAATILQDGKFPLLLGGEHLVTPLKTRDFGRIAAQTAKHVIRQGIREAERSQQLSEIQSKAHDIVQATVTRVDPERGIVAVDLGKGGEAILPRNEQVPGEVYTEGQLLQVYIVDVVSGERGARVMISRTHPGLVKRLFELEVPEIFDGTVEVKAISREAGARTKMAVWSKDPNVNPVSACIGPHGDRVAAVVEKLGGEKIDIVKWSEDVAEFISAALSPAKVVKVELLPGETRSCRVTVPDQQLSLAIGNKGQNARLCARLTGYNIDIRPESGYYGEEEPAAQPAAEQ